MCLIVRNYDEHRIAEKEIPVYKVIDQDGYPPFFDGVYLGTQARKKYKYHFGSNKPKDEKMVEISPRGYRSIEGGFLHAYTDRETANNFSEFETTYQNARYYGRHRNFQVVEMYIPVGAEYYSNPDIKEICSTELIWKEEETCA